MQKNPCQIHRNPRRIMSPNFNAILAQHAKTTQLLGVDFLPVGTPPPQLITAATDPNPADPNQPNFQSAPQSADSMIEAKPSQPNFAVKPQFQPQSPLQSVSIESIRAAYESEESPQAKLDALLKKYTEDAPHAHFTTSFNNIVFGEGNPQADLMFIGEAPGEQEDQTGRPFVGRAGQLLDKMIIAMGLSRESVYIANVLKTRPPNNATPTHDEAAACAPYLYEQIRIVNPKVIVTLGLPATHLLLSSTATMRSLRGQFHTFPTPNTPIDLPQIDLMPTYHPAYLLRSYTEDNRRKVWSDLTAVIERLGLNKP
jgi:uracil-DNA glycosylase